MHALFSCAALIVVISVLLRITISDHTSLSHHVCRPSLNVTNDGPVLLDVPVTITAILDCITDNSTHFLFVFEDDMQRKVEVVQSRKATAVYTFSEGTGLRSVDVSVYLLHLKTFLVAFEETTFLVEEYISGSLELSGVTTDTNGHRYISTKQETNITLRLNFPQQIMRESELAYSWTIDNQHFSTDTPYKLHNFTEPGMKWIRVAAVGRVPVHDGYRFKWGYFDSDVTVKKPFSNINISGNTYLQHGQLLNLDISCDGSGPVEYCWKVLPPSGNSTNLACAHPVTGRECSFPILYYFRDSGNYQLLIYVNNLITSMQRKIEVHIYDVSLRPQLSTVILPLVCTVLVLLIVATAIVLHMRRNTNYDIETADFDFMREPPNPLQAVESSWEVMQRSLWHLLRMHWWIKAAAEGQVGYGTMQNEAIGVKREASSTL